MEEYANLNKILSLALTYCKRQRKEFVMPEHVLMALLNYRPFIEALYTVGCDVEEMYKELNEYMDTVESVPGKAEYSPEASVQLGQMLEIATAQVEQSEAARVDIPHLTVGLLNLTDSEATMLLNKYLGDNVGDFISLLISSHPSQHEDNRQEEHPKEAWRSLVTCMNDIADSFTPLIGRDEELERTIQVLCRKDKNNPLHVGEPGVGKTALVRGLVARIVRGDVPERLRGCHVYQMDMSTMLAGTQFRGDFEKRMKLVMDGIAAEGNAIVYIDEIHNMMGAGRGSDGALDASNMLKPYMENSNIRFIGSTTYDEYNRHMARSRGIVRRFQQIDIAEPDVEETIRIISGLKDKYEQFHGVEYTEESIAYAVRMAAQHISDRFLPDKAIDLIDEAGAYRATHPSAGERHLVDKSLMTEVLMKMCKIDAAVMKEDDNTRLASLEQNIKARIYGQDEAVSQVVEAVQMAKAGLLDDNKPLASLLFVGPTGVGKTEVARVLAAELGISLVRFDMSEYTEKHTVAKLIGSPAGYVGYEDGGQLTDAIRKTPNCVLLFDEIEKAHPDIYNILLQVMDYARLTDNKGQKADFRNVVIIMTSNAGAQYASRAQVGFAGGISQGDAMMKQVKKTFKPEFINRLSATVVFHDMDMHMATLIMDKKLGELQEKLSRKNITMKLSEAARQWILKRGFTKEYGARELDRIISRHLKTMLTHEILFGRLAKGGEAEIDIIDDRPALAQ